MRYYEGPLDAKIAIVGEAPSNNEIKTGRPFVGYDGQQLTELLHSAGIHRSNCFITNTIHEYVNPINGIDSWVSQRAGRVTCSAKYQEYANELQTELQTIRPNVIVPLGNAALYAITGQWGITSRRGSITHAKWDETQKVIGTIHPGAIRKNYLYIYPIKHDLKKIARESLTSEIRLPKHSMLIQPTFDQVIQTLEDYHKYNLISVDIEVAKEQVACIAFSYSSHNAICIPFLIDNREDYWQPEQEAQIWSAIADLLEDPKVTKLGHNMAFDCDFLFRRYGIATSPIEDTMIATGIAFPDHPKALHFISSIYTNEPYYKDEIKKWMRLYLPDDRFWEYNCKDVLVTYKCYEPLIKELELQHNLETYRHQVSLITPLLFIMGKGLRVDIEKLISLRDKHTARVAEIEAELTAISGAAFNPRSPKQVGELLYIKQGNTPYRKKGKISTDETALKRLARKGDKTAQLLLEHRKTQKLLSSYLQVKLDTDGRLRGSMNPVGTKNGRFSSSKSIFDTGLNTQTLPDIMKQCIIADEGYFLYSSDLSQAENRIVAYIAPEPAMIEAFETGQDVHSLTGALISNRPVSEIAREHKEKIFAPIGSGDKSWRFWGKKANHSLNYDEGYRTFSLINEIPENEARFIVERYHQIYPGVRRYHAWIRAQLGQNRTIINPFGRRRVFMERWGDDMFKDAYAFIPQSTVAYIINERGIQFFWKDQTSFRPVHLLNQVHDSIVYQIPVSEGWEYAAGVVYALHKSLNQPIIWHDRIFQIPVDTEMGISLSDDEPLTKITSQDKDEIFMQVKINFNKLLELYHAQKSA